MNILVIDNNIDQDSWGAPDLRKYAAKTPGATVHVRRAPHDDLPADCRRFDRLVVSGSRTSCLEEAPWITRLDALIRSALDEGKPTLGVCYGHQALIRVLGGKDHVRRGTTPEFGWTEIHTLAASPLLKGLPEKFYSFSAHYEEAFRLPKGMRHLARSERCEIQACQLENRPVFGIQFHPEKGVAEAEKTFAERKKKGEPKELLHPGESGRLYDAAVGDRIFSNFFGL